MPSFLVRLGDDKYCEWSTVVDAPVSTVGTMEELLVYYRTKYGYAGMDGLPSRLARVAKKGCSALFDMTAECLIQGNRAGPNGTTLTLEEIIEQYSE